MTFKAYCLNLFRQLHAAELIFHFQGTEMPARPEKVLRWLERRYHV